MEWCNGQVNGADGSFILLWATTSRTTGRWSGSIVKQNDADSSMMLYWDDSQPFDRMLDWCDGQAE